MDRENIEGDATLYIYTVLLNSVFHHVLNSDSEARIISLYCLRGSINVLVSAIDFWCSSVLSAVLYL